MFDDLIADALQASRRFFAGPMTIGAQLWDVSCKCRRRRICIFKNIVIAVAIRAAWRILVVFFVQRSVYALGIIVAGLRMAYGAINGARILAYRVFARIHIRVTFYTIDVDAVNGIFNRRCIDEKRVDGAVGQHTSKIVIRVAAETILV